MNSSKVTSRRSLLLSFALFTTISACSSTTRIPPGHAVLDLKPERAQRERISKVHAVSVNGQPAHGSSTKLTPGNNDVRIRLKWPQAESKDVDLRFHAVEGHSYFVKYDPFPPTLESDLSHQDLMFENPASLLFSLPYYLAVTGIAESASWVSSGGPPAQYIDLLVVAKDSPEGIVRRVRAYPDGRVDAKPWDAYAQTSAP